MKARLLVVAFAALVTVPAAGAGIVTHVGDVFSVPAPKGALPDLRPLTLLGRDHDRLVLQCIDAACAPPRRVAVRGLPEIVLRPRATTSEVAHPGTSFRRETWKHRHTLSSKFIAARPNNLMTPAV